MTATPRTRAILLAFSLGLAFCVLYGLTQQRIPVNDAYQYMQRLNGGDLIYNHIAYLPSLWLFKKTASIFFAITPLQTLTLSSALFGGATVGVAFWIANRYFNDCARAAAVAVLLGFTAGFWFHATTSGIYAFHALFTALALGALLRCVQSRVLGWTETAGVALAVALAPATHLSGVAVALPACAAALLSIKYSPDGWKRVWIALGASAGLFLFIYEYLHRGAGTVSDYQNSIVGNYYMQRLQDPSTIPEYLGRALNELLVFSAPASILILAGLRAEFATRRAETWIFGAWIAGYFGICALIGDRFYGSYFISTFLVQCLLAIVAIPRIARGSIARAAFIIILGIAPAVVDFARPGAGVAVALPLLVILTFAVGPRTERPLPAIVWILPAAAAAVFSIVTIVPREILKTPEWEAFGKKEMFEKVDAVLAGAPKNCNFLVTETDEVTSGYWNHVLSLARPDRFFCIIFLDTELLAENSARQYAEIYRNALRDRAAAGEPVWILGPLDPPKLGPRATAFWNDVKSTYQIADGGLADQNLRDIHILTTHK
ncbi:MAG: DUF2723 domain-containing protein [Planctomycetes bacterium]|nr:DUF2723 domain-containing protein [Planctomycetota bacterium]